MNNVRPFTMRRDHVRVRVEQAEIMENGLFAPAQAQAENADAGELHDIILRGTIIDMGPGKRSKKTGERLSMDVKIGDKVLFTAFTAGERTNGAARPTPWEDDDVMMHESELLAVLTKPKSKPAAFLEVHAYHEAAD